MIHQWERMFYIQNAYIRRIRNVDKHSYALSYLNYLAGLTDLPPKFKKPGAMAKQAVEIELRRLWNLVSH